MGKKIGIIEYSDDYYKKIINLILHIQQIELNTLVTLDEQPDLLDIPRFYQRGNGNFWIALRDNEVIGTMALMDIGQGFGALRKMFVNEKFRGKGHRIAQRMLEVLWIWAEQNKMNAIFLGTTEKFAAQQRFYEKNGFERIEKSKLPDGFPLMRVDKVFYVYDIEGGMINREM